MIRFVFLRLGMALPTLLGASLLVFLILRVIPGDPAEIMLGEQANPADIAQLRHELGLDKPFFSQMGEYYGQILSLRFGRSLKSDREAVMAKMLRVYPTTLLLALLSLCFAWLCAIPLGLLSAIRHHRFLDKLISLAGLLGVSVPNFWLGPMLIILFALHLGLVHVSGLTHWYDWLLPVVTLGTALWALLIRQTRSSVLEVLRLDYVTTARAKGLPAGRVLFRHVLRNALIPIVTVAGLQLGSLLSGAVITEKVFAINGLGSLLIDSVKSRDYPVVQGAVLLIAFSYILVNVVTDMAYALIDPRIGPRE